MATTGAPYNIPYSVGSDPPAGFSQQQALATALATELARIDAAATSLLTNFNNHAASTAAHGATGAVMGTTNTQTVSNKTLDFRGGNGYNTASNILWSVVVQAVGGQTLAAKLAAMDTAIASAGGTVSWASITGKPATFPPDAHSHSYAAVTHYHSQYAGTSHDHDSLYALFTQGDTYGKTPERTVNYANGTGRVHNATSTNYAVWVDSSGMFGRNTSSRRYKTNIRDHDIDPAAVLALQPRMFDRKDGGTQNEFGMVAEESNEVLPEITIRDQDGQIDGIRYDLLPVAMLSVLKDQQRRIEQLEALLGL